MTRLVKTVLLVAGLAAALWFGAHWYAEYRVRHAFAQAGMSDKAAACMGRRLVKHLSLAQLQKLTALQEEKHTVHGLVKAVRRMDDPRIVDVTGTSALLCTAGFAR
ncbi:hypothetical protein [Novosphingobium sp. BL-52-GroH]|uniref:hypothetical protein n=1 Tax=Novosphingobium sp. BL-52-GroH TaxID=3349877 RepID=UPI00384E2FBA